MYTALTDGALFALMLLVLVLLLVLLFLRDSLIDVINQFLHRSRKSSLTGSSQFATVRSRFKDNPEQNNAQGKVFMNGTLWTACCSVQLAESLEVGDRVEIDEMDGLVARVKGKAV